MPASRKLCGFLGHSATMGCNKCYSEFPGTVDEKVYGGFDVSNWKSRDLGSHLEVIRKIKKCRSKGEREAVEKSME